MTEQTETKDSLNGSGSRQEPVVINRPEKLGLLLHEIDENCLVLRDGELVFEDAKVEIDSLNIANCKTDWERGYHIGDCTNFPASCPSCFWQKLVDVGCSLALALTPGSNISLEQVLDDSEEYGDELKDVAEKFRAEVKRLAL